MPSLISSPDQSRLRVDRLAVGYVGEVVLEICDFSLGRGEVAIIRGENGSGKTTLLKTLAGFLVPIVGRYEWSLRDSLIAYLPQDRSLFGSLTIGENLALLSSDPRAALSRTEALLDRPLGRSRSARSLSGGEARLVALAGVLTGPAQALLLDEPFAALANSLVPSMIEWLDNEAKTTGRTFILVEHRQVTAPAWRTYRVEDGILRSG